MKNQKPNVDRHGKSRVANPQNGRHLYQDDPIPGELLEKPRDARKKQLEDNEMPSDFWF